MKVVCDNCRAVYKVPDKKLVKPVNKATCRQCGHRMLIPKPKPGADPDERTLVTAVPPTPVGAPPRDDGGPHTTPIDDEPEQTLPGRPAQEDVQVFPGTPLPQHRHDEASPYVTRPSASPPPASRKPQRSPTPRPPQSRPHTPPPGRPRSHEPGLRPMANMPPRHTPLPTQERTVVLDTTFDPSSDLAWALVGTLASLMGAFLLAFLSVFSDPLITRLVMWFGLALAFGGGVTTLLVLVTGGRGRYAARTLTSVVIGFGIALVSATGLVGMQAVTVTVIDRINFNTDIDLAELAAAAEPLQPQASDAPSLASLEPTGTDEVSGTPSDDGLADGDDPEDELSEPVEAAAAPRPTRPRPPRATPRPRPPAPRPTPPASDGVADAGNPPSTTSSPPPPAPRPAPTPPPPAADPEMTSVPVEVVHTMLSNNLEIKKCFVPLFRAGTLPNRVDVRLSMLPSGRVEGVGIVDPQYAGTELDRCLAMAITAVKFPPSSVGQKLVYPFILQ